MRSGIDVGMGLLVAGMCWFEAAGMHCSMAVGRHWFEAVGRSWFEAAEKSCFATGKVAARRLKIGLQLRTGCWWHSDSILQTYLKIVSEV